MYCAARASVAPGPVSSLGISRATTASRVAASAAVSVSGAAGAGERTWPRTSATGMTATAAPMKPARLSSSRRENPQSSSRVSAISPS